MRVEDLIIRQLTPHQIWHVQNQIREAIPKKTRARVIADSLRWIRKNSERSHQRGERLATAPARVDRIAAIVKKSHHHHEPKKRRPEQAGRPDIEHARG